MLLRTIVLMVIKATAPRKHHMHFLYFQIQINNRKQGQKRPCDLASLGEQNVGVYKDLPESPRILPRQYSENVYTYCHLPAKVVNQQLMHL